MPPDEPKLPAPAPLSKSENRSRSNTRNLIFPGKLVGAEGFEPPTYSV